MLNISCKACGREVPADAKFCSGCAAPIQSQDSQQQPQQPPPIRQSAPTTTTLYANSVPPPPAYVFTPPAPPPPAASVAAAKPPPPPADVPPVGHPNAVSSVQAEEATSETLKREAAELERLEKLRIEKERLEQAQREEEARRLKEAERLELERKAQEAERIAQEQRYRARKERERAEREQREREAAMARDREERESRERAERERIEREMRENEQKQKLKPDSQNQEQQGSLAINTKEVESFHKEEEKQSRPKLLFSFAIVCCLLFGFLLLKLQKEREAKSPFENSVASTNCGDMRAAIVVYDDFDVGGKLSRWVIFRQALVAVDSGYASYSWPTDVWSFNYVRREGNGELRDATVRYKVEQDSYRVMEATERGTKFIENFTYKYPPDKAGKPTEIWSFCSPNTAIHHRWFASNFRLRSDFPPPKPPLK